MPAAVASDVVANEAKAEEVALPEIDPLKGTTPFLWAFRINVFALLVLAAFLGGPLVRVGAIAAMLLAMFGDRAGAVRHLLYLFWLPVSIAVAKLVGGPVGGLIAGAVGVSQAQATAFGSVLLALGILLGLAAVGARVQRFVRKHRYLFVGNHVAGGLLGATEGLLMAAALSWLLAIFGPSLEMYSVLLARSNPQLAHGLKCLTAMRSHFQADPVSRWVDEVNPLTHVPQVMAVAALAEMTAEPGRFWALVDDGRLDALLTVPVVRRHLDALRADQAMQKAIETRDLRAILRSGHLSAALDDDELCRAVAERWPTLRAGVSNSEMSRARQAVNDLGGLPAQHLNRAEQRAEEFDIDLP